MSKTNGDMSEKQDKYDCKHIGNALIGGWFCNNPKRLNDWQSGKIPNLDCDLCKGADTCPDFEYVPKKKEI